MKALAKKGGYAMKFANRHAHLIYRIMPRLAESRAKRLTFDAVIAHFCTGAITGNDGKTGYWRGAGRAYMVETAHRGKRSGPPMRRKCPQPKPRGHRRSAPSGRLSRFMRDPKGSKQMGGGLGNTFYGKTTRGGMAAAVAALAALLLAGCSEEGGKTPHAAPAEGTAGQRSTKYDPPIVLTTVGTMYAAPVYPPGDDMNDNEWTRHLRDNLGIVVRKWWEAPPDQQEQKTNLMIASGDIPDFFIATPKQLVLLARANLIEPLDDVYPRHATAAVRAVIEQAGPEVLEAAEINGKLMGIPFTGVAKESVPVLWIREDWRQKLDLPRPNTMDDLLAIAKAFATRDPDGNGKHDTYGLGLDKSLSMAVGFFNGFHAYKGIWVRDSNGRLAYGSIQPEMKLAVGKLRDMYVAGQLDPDFSMKEGSKVHRSIADNKLGMVFASISAATLYQYSPDSRWFAYAAPSSDSRPALVQHGLNLQNGFWVVKKGTKNPEAILRMADEFVSKFYLNTSDEVYKRFNFDISTKTSVWTQAPVKLFKSYKNAEISAHLEPFLLSGKDPSAFEKAALTPEEREKYGQIKDYLSGKSADWSVIARNGLGGGGTVILDYVENDQMLLDRFYGPPTKTMVQKQANLQRLEEEVLTKIILGAPLDEFDKFVDDWRRLGGDDITNEVNEWAQTK